MVLAYSLHYSIRTVLDTKVLTVQDAGKDSIFPITLASQLTPIVLVLIIKLLTVNHVPTECSPTEAHVNENKYDYVILYLDILFIIYSFKILACPSKLKLAS